MRLGRLPHDGARVARVPGARLGLVPPPARVPLPAWTPGLWGNDTLPDCTAVALINAARAFSVLLGDTDLTADTQHVTAIYARAIGRIGATADQLAATDGAVLLDVLEQAQDAGAELSGEVPYVPDFAAVADWPGIANAVARFGCAILGVDLYAADMDADAGAPWDTSRDPGSLAGGHALLVAAYDGLGDGDTAWCGTWGAWRPATWRWIAARTRESYVTAWRQTIAPARMGEYPALLAEVTGWA